MDKKCGPKMMPSDTKTLRDDKRQKIRELKEITEVFEGLRDAGISCDTIKARMISRGPSEPAEPTHGPRERSSHLSLSAPHPPTSSKSEPTGTMNDTGLHRSTQPNLFQSNDLLPPSIFPSSSADRLTELPSLDNPTFGEMSTFYNEGTNNFPPETATLWPQQFDNFLFTFEEAIETDFNFSLE
jgi:hypothetical protein